MAQERDLRYQQRFDAQNTALDAARVAAKEGVTTALIAAEKAVDKANIANEKRFEGVNEFRQTLADQARDLMPRAECEQRLTQLSTQIAALTGSSRAGATALFGWIVGAVGLVATLLAVTGVLG
jgi:hypothetical protein